MIMGKDINRIKGMLVEKKPTNKWLAELFGKDIAYVSRWYMNSIQPSLNISLVTAEYQDVSIQEPVRMHE